MERIEADIAAFVGNYTRKKGYPPTVEELIEANAKGEFKEMFGTGTAAVISPVGELKCGDTIIPINNGEIGEISQMLYDKITGMQFGKLPDEFGWTVVVK